MVNNYGETYNLGKRAFQLDSLNIDDSEVMQDVNQSMPRYNEPRYSFGRDRLDSLDYTQAAEKSKLRVYLYGTTEAKRVKTFFQYTASA